MLFTQALVWTVRLSFFVFFVLRSPRSVCVCYGGKKDFNKWIWEQTRAGRHRQIGSWSVRDESSQHSKVAVLNELDAVVSPKGDR